MPSLGTCVASRRSLLAPSCQVRSIRSFLILQASDQPLFVTLWPAGKRGHLGGCCVPHLARRHWTVLPCWRMFEAQHQAHHAGMEQVILAGL